MSDRPDPLAQARAAYEKHRDDWSFLGYPEPLALAVLGAFFGLERVRNRSPKPLNVLSMVGKGRIRAIKAELDAAAPPASDD